MIHVYVLPTKNIITKTGKPYLFLKLAMLSTTHSLMFVTASIFMATMALLCLSSKPAVAEIPATPTKGQPGIKTMSQVNMLFVNPSVGDDKNGNGIQRTPFKTITQALKIATPNTVIVLSEGTYSANNGEIFPLILKPGTSIQGDRDSKGSKTVITGGGDYLSRSFGSKNVTIVGVNQSGLIGVTVTNSNPRGYGLWLESSNSVVTENTFTGSTQDGISVAGESTAVISKNLFERNGANGMTISGNARPQVQENVFRDTGYGINIVDNAQPTIVSNAIVSNRCGILVQGSSRPVLRTNLIQNNREDGLVAIAVAIPDLGNASAPGGNQFSNNERYEINAEADKQNIVGYGNTFGSLRIAGNVDIGNTTASVRQSPQLQANREVTFSAPVADAISKLSKLSSQTTALQPTRNALGKALQPSNSIFSPPPSPQSLKFPTPSQQGIAPTPTRDIPQLNYVQIDNKSIEFTAPRAVARKSSLPTLKPTNIGETQQPTAEFPTPYNKPTSSLATAPQTNFRYRVVVQVKSERDEQIVRFVAPDAFPTVWQGRTVMQVGVFSSTFYANDMVNILKNNGLQAVIQPY